MKYGILSGDVLEQLRDLPENSADGLLCDPPYGLSFMGKAWDYDVPGADVWKQALRVLKPGAPLLAFGGARTSHRLAVAIEDAGFELRDTLMWVYGSGFPKSQNISIALDKDAGAMAHRGVGITVAGRKPGAEHLHNGSTVEKHKPVTELAQDWDGYGTALKPAYEPIILARKPLEGTMANNVNKWGVGGLAIDATRIGEAGGTTKAAPTPGSATTSTGFGGHNGSYGVPIDGGRWPANLLLGHTEDCCQIGVKPGPGFARNRHTEGANPWGNAAGKAYTSEPVPEEVEVWECVEGCPVKALDAQVAPTVSKKGKPRKGKSGDGWGMTATGAEHEDSGGPSRFFYCSKVGRREREFGCDGLAMKSAGEVTDREDGSAGLNSPRAGAGRGTGNRNNHPTLKPISLITYLAKLILPPSKDALLLVPFCGSGSEVIGALQAGWPAVLGIEREEPYIEIAHARIPANCPGVERA